MKRTLLAIALAAAAATAFAAGANDQYRNTAGEPDQHQPELGAIDSSYMVASADQYRPNAGESTDNNVVQNQVG
ncbi:MAG TPA: hypothetical protein VN929_03280 [Burkholderiales bacterium]|nr:hypothetical protein [Burkholderiales bacterium]